jgi:hypothetical protein
MTDKKKNVLYSRARGGLDCASLKLNAEFAGQD